MRRRVPRDHFTVTQAKQYAVIEFDNGAFPFGQWAYATGQAIAYGTDIPQFGSYQQVFDEYRIKKVRYEFIPIQNVGSAGMTETSVGGEEYIDASGNTQVYPEDATAPTYGIPWMWTVVDTDGPPPGGITRDLLARYPRVKRRSVSRPFSVTLTPRPMGIVSNSTSSLVPVERAPLPRGQWLDTATPSIPHYGLMWTMSTAEGSPGRLNIAQLARGWKCEIIQHTTIEFRHVI